MGLVGSRVWSVVADRARHFEECPLHRRTLFAVGLGVAALLIQAALTPLIGPRETFLTLFPAVLIAGLICGFGCAMVTLAVMTPATLFWFLEPVGGRIATFQTASAVAIGLGAAVFVGYAGAALRGARLRMRRLLSETRALAAALAQNEERFRRTVDQSPEAIVIHDGGAILYANPAAAALLRAPAPAALLGRAPLDFVHPSAREEVRERIERTLRSGRPTSPQEVALLRLDGSAFDGEAWAAPLPRDDRTVIQVILRDVSERKRTERELARSNADLEDFAQVVAHDLKEPLRGIVEFTGRLARCDHVAAGTEAADAAETITRLSQRMAELVEGLVRFARVGRGGLAVEEHDLGEIARAAADSLRTLVEREHARVEIGPLPRLPCDRVHIGQVFANLIANALRYNQSKEKRVEVFARYRGGAPEVCIRDNGIGIAPRHHRAVFQMFRRLHPRGRFGGGTGAGLAIVRKVVERHGGRVWVESELGRGATFCFTLAAAAARAPAGDHGTRGAGPAAGEERGLARGAPGGRTPLPHAPDRDGPPVVEVRPLRRATPGDTEQPAI